MSTNVTTSVTDVMLVGSYQQCQATCTNYAGDNSIIINNGTVKGNVGFKLNCFSEVECVMNNQINNITNQIMNSVADSSTASQNSVFGLVVNDTSNSSNINQSYINYITQIVETTCNSSVAFNTKNNLIYLSDTDVKGFVGFSIGSTSSAAVSSCNMSNVSKIAEYNSQQSTTTQEQKKSTILSTIYIVFIIFIFLIIILLIISIFFRIHR